MRVQDEIAGNRMSPLLLLSALKLLLLPLSLKSKGLRYVTHAFLYPTLPLPFLSSRTFLPAFIFSIYQSYPSFHPLSSHPTSSHTAFPISTLLPHFYFPSFFLLYFSSPPYFFAMLLLTMFLHRSPSRCSLPRPLEPSLTL